MIEPISWKKISLKIFKIDIKIEFLKIFKIFKPKKILKRIILYKFRKD